MCQPASGVLLHGIIFSAVHKIVVMAVDTENQRLSFPQRYWLLLCILVAVFSPLAVQWLHAAADRFSYHQAVNHPSVKGGEGGSSPSGGAVAPGDTPRPGAVNPMTPPVHPPVTDSGK